MKTKFGSPTWFYEGETIHCDELGFLCLTALESGWYVVVNRYGKVHVDMTPFFPVKVIQ